MFCKCVCHTKGKLYANSASPRICDRCNVEFLVGNTTAERQRVLCDECVANTLYPDEGPTAGDSEHNRWIRESWSAGGEISAQYQDRDDEKGSIDGQDRGSLRPTPSVGAMTPSKITMI